MLATPVPVLIARLLEMNDGSCAAVARLLATTEASLSRWRSGVARPRLSVVARMEALTASDESKAPLFATEQPSNGLARVELAIAGLLSALREEFHKGSSLSSQQEVLDLVAVLLFAHIASLNTGGLGIGRHLRKETRGSSRALNSFLESQIREHLTNTSLTDENRGESFLFRPFDDVDDHFVDKLMHIFQQDLEAFSTLHQAGRDDIINEVFSRFVSTSFVDEKEMGQYLTPPEIVNFMVDLGVQYAGDELLTSGIILDPSCGVASFLSAAVRTLHAKARLTLPRLALARWADQLTAERVIGIDKSERMTRLAALGLALFSASKVNVHQANALARTGPDGRLADSLRGKVKLILTNPPFGATYKGAETVGYEMRAIGGGAESEIMFLERYYDWLAPNGIVVSVVPDSVLVNRGAFARLREWLFERCAVLSVVSLPASTFAAAGTSVKTSVLVFQKLQDRETERRPTYLAVANQIGFVVSTRAGRRRRIHTPLNDLPVFAREISKLTVAIKGRFVELSHAAKRWDAPFHIGLPLEHANIVDSSAISFLKVSDVATLADERRDPRRHELKTFKYIEISDVDLKTGIVGFKDIESRDAPSRARKLVKAGDVLVSTVRPERGTIGVVPDELDGATCSTGFAVLRPTGIDPLALVWLLKTETVKHQMLRHNIGIAYPAIAEDTCAGLVLPIRASDLYRIKSATEDLQSKQRSFLQARNSLIADIQTLVTPTATGLGQTPDFVNR